MGQKLLPIHQLHGVHYENSLSLSLIFLILLTSCDDTSTASNNEDFNSRHLSATTGDSQTDSLIAGGLFLLSDSGNNIDSVSSLVLDDFGSLKITVVNIDSTTAEIIALAAPPADPSDSTVNGKDCGCTNGDNCVSQFSGGAWHCSNDVKACCQWLGNDVSLADMSAGFAMLNATATLPLVSVHP